jgi:hypothetical protein
LNYWLSNWNFTTRRYFDKFSQNKLPAGSDGGDKVEVPVLEDLIVLEDAKKDLITYSFSEPPSPKGRKMRSSLIIAGIFTTAFGQVQYTSTGTAAIAKAKATALTESPTSNVAGKSFSRFVTIWCENTDYDMAAGDRKWNPRLHVLDANLSANFAWIASQGITLTNYLAITHPSQPNYVAAVGGSTHGVTSDSFTRISSSSKTIVDLLEAKGVSWSEYQEDSPYSGFEGNYVNQKTGANDYVRKHK